MKKGLIFAIILVAGTGFIGATARSTKWEDPNLKLWYDRPAAIWEEALPLGNGKCGAMVFGGIVTGRYQLNPAAKVERSNKNPLLEILLAKDYILDFETGKGKSYTLVPL